MHLDRILAISTRGNKDISQKGLCSMRQGGIEAIEIASDPVVMESIDFKRLKKDISSEDIRPWSFHLPYQGAHNDPSTSDREMQEIVYKNCSGWINTAAELGCSCCVIHPGGEPDGNINRSEKMKYSKNMLNRLAHVAQSCNIQLAVECLPRECVGNSSEEIKELIEDSDFLKVCFDTNHLMQKENQKEFIEAVGKNIITMHISDYDRMNERHWMPGEGIIMWEDVLVSLDKIGYTNAFVYEVNMEPPCTIERRLLEYKDFKMNFDELQSGKKLTRIGTPKERLGMWAPLE